MGELTLQFRRERVECRAWGAVVGRHYVVHYDPKCLSEKRARESLDGAEKRIKVIIERHVKAAFGKTLKQLDAGWRRMLSARGDELARLKPTWAEKLDGCIKMIKTKAAKRLCELGV